MKILFASDIHGSWIQFYDRAEEYSPDLVFLCGDTEPIRNVLDLESVPGPARYRKMGNFVHFWNQKRVPIPTYLIMGNHEPFGWFIELEHCHKSPVRIVGNLCYLGRSGCVRIQGITVAWLSRVYSPKTFDGQRTLDAKDRRSKVAGHFTRPDVEALIGIAKGGEADYLIMHENPRHPQDERHKRILMSIVDAVKPKKIICGHTHRRETFHFGGFLVECVNDREFYITGEDTFETTSAPPPFQ